MNTLSKEIVKGSWVVRGSKEKEREEGGKTRRDSHGYRKRGEGKQTRGTEGSERKDGKKIYYGWLHISQMWIFHLYPPMTSFSRTKDRQMLIVLKYCLKV